MTEEDLEIQIRVDEGEPELYGRQFSGSITLPPEIYDAQVGATITLKQVQIARLRIEELQAFYPAASDCYWAISRRGESFERVRYRGFMVFIYRDGPDPSGEFQRSTLLPFMASLRCTDPRFRWHRVVGRIWSLVEEFGPLVLFTLLGILILYFYILYATGGW